MCNYPISQPPNPVLNQNGVQSLHRTPFIKETLVQPADTILQTLRDAVRVSPDNLPLRQHLADTLLQHARFADAESEYRTCLSLITQATT